MNNKYFKFNNQNHIQMRPFKIIVAIAAFLMMAQMTIAQFTLSGEYRPRAEYRHGFKTLPGADQDAAFFIDQRSRLNVDFQNKGFRTFFSLQDIRTWGSTSQLNSTDGFTSVHQAWFEAFLNEKISFKAGRQEIVYDDHRIFGSVGWAQQARSHDAAILKIKTSDKFQVHLGGAFNQNGPGMVGTYYTVPKNYKSMLFLWARITPSENFGASLLFLNNTTQPSATMDVLDTLGNVIGSTTEWINVSSQTVGARLNYKKNKLKANANVYYQMGSATSAYGFNDEGEGEWTDTDLAAYLAGVDVAYQVSDAFGINAGFEMQSGNSQTDTSNAAVIQQNAFSPFYGTNHKFNGHMDYFYVGNHGGSVGLMDIFVGAKFKKNKNVVALTAHMFSAAADVLDQEKFVEDGTYNAMSSSLGTEFDFSYARPLAEGVTMKLGYSHLLGTETLQAIKGGDFEETANWGYLMVIVKPTFFTTKK